MPYFLSYNPHQFLQQLNELNPDIKPNWGKMTPQHMVEHLIIIFKIANGSIPSKLAIPEGKLPDKVAFLHSDQEFARGIVIKGLQTEDLRPLRFENLQAAIEKLDKEMKRFEEAFAENSQLKTVHPVFGPLDYDGWITFHRKHMTHHFKQFGLV